VGSRGRAIAVSTKPVRRPTHNFVDSLIGSIGSIYLTIISFALIYGYVSMTLYLQSETLPALIALDKLLLLRDLSNVIHNNIRDARINDLPNFFSGAIMDQLDETIQEDERQDGPEAAKKEKVPSKFTAELLQASKILRDIPMRMAIGGTCDVLVTKLSAGHEFNITTNAAVTGTYSVASEDIQFATFRGCAPGLGFEFRILIFKIDDGQYAFAIPRSWPEQFRVPPTPFGLPYPPFREFDQVVPLLPQPMAQYADFDLGGEHVILHEKAVDYLILHYAETHLGKHFAANKLNEAAQQVYEQKENEASYFGITAPVAFLVRIGPLIYFALSVELWRRVRRLPSGRIASDKYWFAFETKDWVGWTYSNLYAFTPLLLGLLIYVMFAISQGLGFFLFGRWVTLPGVLTLNFPFIFGASVNTDYFALGMVAVLLLHLIILVLTVRKLARVVAANRREPIR
jgi:hypothetical protein